MPRKRRQRTKGTSPHPGVVLRSRTWVSGATTWFARWRDGLTRREHDTSLTALGLTNEAGRRAWAIAKSADLARERQAVSSGKLSTDGPRKVNLAVADYIARAKARLRPRAIEGYEDSLARFETWAGETRLPELRRLTGPLVARFRDWLAAVPRARARSGNPAGEPRAPASINRDISHVKAFLNDARRLGLVPNLDSDAIKDGLRRVSGNRPRPRPLRTKELCRLLEAALRHDESCWAMTRDEKAGKRRAGTTPRYEPIAPLVLVTLLTGARIGELLGLTWESVELDADNGRGTLVVQATISKTRTERDVDLALCPRLVALLARMRLAATGPFVFGGDRARARHDAENARHRMTKFGAPRWNWQGLRVTCQCYLVCAPNLLGSGAPYLAAARAGHSVAVSEKHYLNALRDLPAERTLERVMGVEDLADQIADAIRARCGEPAATAARA